MDKEDEIVDLGQGSLFIGELDPADLSGLEAFIISQELAGKTGEIELEMTE
jgi:hypothetical protein